MITKDSYFNTLNYSLANEDTTLERTLSLYYKSQNIVTVCGSGSRAIPLISSHTKKLTIVDLSEEQIFLAKLRLATYQQLDYEDFLFFWGYPNPLVKLTDKRKKIFQSIKLEISVKNYFEIMFHQRQWSSLLYCGKWESTFVFFSKIVKKFLGAKNVDKLFSFKNLDEQRYYLENDFPRIRWKILIALLGNKPLFNALLYKGHFIRKNVPETYFHYYNQAFHRLMNNSLSRNSFFLQLCFLGEIVYEEGLPTEAKREVFDDIKKNLPHVEIQFFNNDVLSVTKNNPSIDFLSFSDVPSYFSNSLEKSFLQDCRPTLSKDAIVVLRNYLRIPDADRLCFKNINSEHKKIIDEETVQMYRIEILKYENSTHPTS